LNITPDLRIWRTRFPLGLPAITKAQCKLFCPD
jgi:hypothetical protein